MEAASALREAPQPLQAARLGASSFAEAGWQAMLSTHRGAKHPFLCRQRQSTALAAGGAIPPPSQPPWDLPAHSTGEDLSPGGHRPSPGEQVLSAPHPQMGLCLPQPLSSCHRAVSPHSSRPPLTAPSQGALLPQEAPGALPSFTPWQSYRAREALPSEEGHFLTQIFRYRALRYHLGGQYSCLSCQFYLAPQQRSAGPTASS